MIVVHRMKLPLSHWIDTKDVKQYAKKCIHFWLNAPLNLERESENAKSLPVSEFVKNSAVLLFWQELG